MLGGGKGIEEGGGGGKRERSTLTFELCTLQYTHFMCHEVISSGVLPVYSGDGLQLEWVVLQTSRFVDENLCTCSQRTKSVRGTFIGIQSVTQTNT